MRFLSECQKSGRTPLFCVLRVLPLAFAPGRQNLQQTKPSGFSSVLTHTPRGPSLAPAGQFTLCRQSRMEHQGLRPLINPGVSRQTEKEEALCASSCFFRCTVFLRGALATLKVGIKYRIVRYAFFKEEIGNEKTITVQRKIQFTSLTVV